MSTDSMLSQFGDALGEIKTSTPLVKAPTDWLRVNIDEIRANAKDVPDFSTHDCAGLSNAGLIYPVSYYFALNDT
jgi:hypothetical protein